MKVPATLTARRAFWAEHVQAWRDSGLTQVAYCEQHQLNAKSFGYWFRSRELQNETLTLVPITVHEPAQTSDQRRRHPSGWEMVFPRAVESAWLLAIHCECCSPSGSSIVTDASFSLLGRILWAVLNEQPPGSAKFFSKADK
ncbi:hypothetical protein [Pseudomonas sp. HY13-MNA-CIBAN-0226]|uniref:IS66 family insertion sequence element accessory protein TnpA n=1 Tax=Pseudomonas sp. HY13-MNA-CIBAN-0226 TaxID=3140473 RepID=UPI00332B0926